MGRARLTGLPTRRRTRKRSGQAVTVTDLVQRRFTAAAPNRLWMADLERHEAFANPGGWWAAIAGCLSQQAWGSWRTVDCLGVGVVG
jgi:hypothetical protein